MSRKKGHVRRYHGVPLPSYWKRSEVGDDNFRQDNDTAAPNSLNGPTGQEDREVPSQCSYERAGKEEYNAQVYKLIDAYVSISARFRTSKPAIRD